MTYHNLKGKQVNKPKEIWLNNSTVTNCIEEELCKQVNQGILREVAEIKVIKKFILNSNI